MYRLLILSSGTPAMSCIPALFLMIYMVVMVM